MKKLISFLLASTLVFFMGSMVAQTAASGLNIELSNTALKVAGFAGFALSFVSVFVPGAESLSFFFAIGQQPFSNKYREWFDRLTNPNGDFKYSKGSVTRSHLRYECAVSNSKSEYKIDLIKGGDSIGNDGTSMKPLQVTLNENDLFVCLDIAYGIVAVNKATKTAVGLNFPEIAVVQTYPNTQVFADVATSGSEFTAAHLNVLWNSFIKYKVGNTTIAERLPTAEAFYVPTTQKSGAGNYSGIESGAGLITLEPSWFLNGKASNDISIIVPSFENMKIVNTNSNYENRIVFQPLGFLIKGGAKNVVE